ncbi:MAG: hypothetical protein OXG08_01800 [Gammaproteobacteria bacterium]|nr:hypothetical protein [Gammaproteobacteria bacterium]
MKIPGVAYRVGGSVRDELMGTEPGKRPAKARDCDWVVTGATPKEMQRAGLKQIGKSFPVYLNPRTGDQYALARTERKTGRGHQAFEFHFDPDVELIEDLRRRDLTINAMARDSDGKLIDPFGGEKDVKDRILRHVSDAFAEDPLRVFRVARFAATLPEFNIAPETREMMRSMQEELADLSAERVWSEYARAMEGLTPFRFFDTLSETESIEPWFSGIAVIGLTSIMRERWLRSIDAIAAIGWVHEEATAVALFRRLKAPGSVVRLGRDVARFGHSLSTILSQDPIDVLSFFERSHAFRPGTAFQRLVAAVQACAGLDLGCVKRLVGQVSKIRLHGIPSNEYGWHLRQARLEAIAGFLKESQRDT